MAWKENLKKAWDFVWYDDGWASWLVNIVLAYIVIKFLIYPGLGWILATPFPVVAVVSDSMEHKGLEFDTWWQEKQLWYLGREITYDDFKKYPFKNGFNKGDIMVLYGTSPQDIELGDVIVFQSGLPYPIIHRVIATHDDQGPFAGQLFYETKGDYNQDQIKGDLFHPLDETYVPQRVLYGEAVFRIPFLGYVKIWFVELLQLAGLFKV